MDLPVPGGRQKGDTIDFFLSSTRSAKAAKRFLGKALRGLKGWEKPTKLNTDKAPSYGVAIAELKREGSSPWKPNTGR
jgi:transposase-like protein